MEDNALKKTIAALQWEANYRKKFEADTSVSKRFLTDETELDRDFEHFICKLNITNCTALDIGTGTGEQAIFLAKKGLQVTATDISASAIKNAKDKAATHQADITFFKDDILSTNLTGQFDLIVDRGCFTLIPDTHKPEYISSVKNLLRPDGWLIIKADKKRNAQSYFAGDKDLSITASENSDYTLLNSKTIKADVIVMRKTEAKTKPGEDQNNVN